MIAALIISGLALAPKHHIKSGILLGLASINPAFSICVPSALIGARVAVVLGISIAISVDIMSLAAYLEPNVFFNWLHQLIHRSTATAIENTTYHSVDTIWVSFQHHIAGLQSGSEGTALIITSVGAFLLVATAFRRSTKRSDRALAIFVAMAMTPVLTPFMPAINFVAPIQITALALLYLYPGWKVAAVQMKRLFFLILAILVLPGFLLLFSSPLVSQAVILASCSIVGIFAALGIQRNPLAGLTDVYDEENIGDGSTPISLDDVINRENVKQEWMRARYWR
ncbi:hypothetical protein ACMV_00560 [Acidiphilium multivorum AIU301]|uniref:DUF2029 domain-containing protein n=1 Tax=Acidiphilium multivorum (strain DSM 11245 / JCM 8867 / NBRC 100883 / AIU 301) TaxID=926570 RepID=F0J121_ACIMA|nr:hypothetical protein ACMV_00560 [Acidiphilium multivorum AIU301]